MITGARFQARSVCVGGESFGWLRSLDAPRIGSIEAESDLDTVDHWQNLPVGRVE